MTLHDDNHDDEVMSQINITPLTDCIMVLLIIFMIASTALSQTGFNIQLPRVSTPEESRPSQVVISVAQNGDIFVGAHRVAPEKLEGYLAKLAAAKRTKRVVINGDAKSAYGSIVTAMDCSKKAGLTSIALATKVAPQE